MNADLESFVPLTFSRRGVQRLATTNAVAHDTTFLVGLARAFYWKSLLDTGAMKSGSEIAKNEGLHHSCVNELMRLTLLAPDIIKQLMAGTQPRRMTLMWFQRNRLPVDWQAQRTIIDGFK
ncbi:site-specific recombinase resolvase [Rhodoferax antarcticus]|uniref:Site-specific recombinase resolvase n=1 Tax=Rhodoferax antarcticus ANT.BR TaxID=1111071 RepID=A0A1Q8YBF5_9BURK|nr:site-specific recombinase resolvase [Rhodoferax antarcticus]APW46821.1 site-specific recombinase resolvase [Rhodoferax antarcticus]OLP05323.1 hypothetical protein BLL52_3448 [Rhodoferax antarcticus ANT.BR]